MTTQSIKLPTIQPMLAFSRAQLIGQLRNWRSSAATLFTPMLLLLLFTLTGDEDAPSLVPFVVGFTVMFSGQTLAQILISWRNNRVFTRLSATPTPTSYLLVATILTQMLLFLLQALLVMIAGLLLNDLTLGFGAFFAIMGVLLIGTTAFLSFGALIAAFIKKVETAGIAYTFLLLPAIFLGGSLFEIPGVGDLGRYLPPTLLTNLLNPLFGFSEASNVLLSIIALAMWSIAFTGIAVHFFNTEG
jgi:ABC-type multidrug transport system permease subunit